MTPPSTPLTPTAITRDQLVLLLNRLGPFRVTAAMVQRDVRDGAPTNADGSFNLIHYTAWLVREHPDGE